MGLTKAQRVLNQFERKEVDYLPSQITFSDRTRDKEISEALKLDSPEQLDDYLENHIVFTFEKNDVPLFFRNDEATMNQLEKDGYVRIDRKNNTAYDNWGMGILIGSDGFFSNYSPLEGNKEANAKAREFLPDRVAKLLDLPLEEAVKKYEAPDLNQAGIYEWLERDKNGVDGDLCVIPSGYFATYERSYAILGWANFMTEIAGNPKLISEMMEKITDYRIKLAKVKADLGYKIVHHGDDLGMQCSGFFSPAMFNELMMPQYKRLFAEYKKYGQYIFMHSCGKMIDYLPQLIDAGLDGWEPVQPCNDLRYIKKEYGKDLVFMGGIDTQGLPFMKPEEVKKMAKEAIEILGKGGGYIIAPAQEIMNDVPLENVVAILETAVDLRDKVI